MRLQLLLTLTASASLVSCIQPEREICMISTADSIMAQSISKEKFQESLAGAEAGDIKAIDVIIAYYLDRGMTDQADFWGRKREIAFSNNE